MDINKIIEEAIRKIGVPDDKRDAFRQGFEYAYSMSWKSIIDAKDAIRMLIIVFVVVFSIFAFKACENIPLQRTDFCFTEKSVEGKIEEYARYKGISLSEWRIGQIMSKTANKSESEANSIIMEIIDDAPTK